MSVEPERRLKPTTIEDELRQLNETNKVQVSWLERIEKRLEWLEAHHVFTLATDGPKPDVEKGVVDHRLNHLLRIIVMMRDPGWQTALAEMVEKYENKKKERPDGD